VRVVGVVTALTLAIVLLSFPALAQENEDNRVIWTLNDTTIIHPEDTLVWVTWNCIYESNQPCVFDTTYFVIGGVKWVTDSTGAINISMDRYTPEELYHDGGIGFNFTVTPQLPCNVRFEISGVPKGEYIIHKIMSTETENITVHASTLKFSDYVTQPTIYVIQIKTLEGVPTKTPGVPFIPPPVEEEKPIIPGLEVVFVVAGLIVVIYLLHRRRSS